MENLLLIFLFSITLVGCGNFAYPDRTFIEQMDHETDGFFVPGQDFAVVPGDNGDEGRTMDEIRQRTPASARTREEALESRSLAGELRAKLNALDEREYDEYVRFREYLPTNSDKLYFLNLPREERIDYLMTRGYAPEISKKYLKSKQNGRGMSYFESRAVRVSDIHHGMSKLQVQDLWGSPTRVDVAGNPANENERWSFYESGKVRQVFFEKGRVAGWIID